MTMLDANVQNLPQFYKQWVVARRNQYTAELVYWTSFSEEEDAKKAALELGDGVVLENVEV